jgi:hypothetical protein
MKCCHCNKQIDVMDKVKGDFVILDEQGKEIDNTRNRIIGLRICKPIINKSFFHTTCYKLHN